MAPRPKARRATYQDVLDTPTWLVAEMVEGELRTSPRPSPRHAYAETQLATLLNNPFGRGVGGPGGWIVLAEPELHLESDAAILVADLAAWRCERLPALPDEAIVRLPPDWICEILSPASAAFDRERKLPIYARTGVAHAWLVDPILRTLEVLVGRSGGSAPVAPPGSSSGRRCRARMGVGAEPRAARAFPPVFTRSRCPVQARREPNES